MEILITGPFGQIGLSVLANLDFKAHNIRLFDIRTKHNQKLAKKYRQKCSIIWGDMRDTNSLEEAIAGVDVVLHMAYILPPITEENMFLAEAVNVTGMKNLLAIAKKQPIPPKILFTSSVSIYGDTRDISQPVTITTRLKPSDYYAEHKIQSTNLLLQSGLTNSILVLAFVPPLNSLTMDPKMFEVPLDTPVEAIHEQDLGLAIVNALDCSEIWGKTLHIAGGKNCRISYFDFIKKSMTAMGLGVLPTSAFGGELYHCSYMDTTESESLLQYQRHSIDDIISDMKNNNRFMVFLTKILQPLAKRYLLSKSPYFTKKQAKNEK